jgi:2-C-methyl-D-erythritol 4-phosphate cytidylyltransferase
MIYKNTAIVLAGGRGKRMGLDIPKQYLKIDGKPLICYTLDCFQNSFIDEIIVVVEKGGIAYFNENILAGHQYSKVHKVVEGGAERYNSVFNGLCAIESTQNVYIHDGARACVTTAILERAQKAVDKYGAAVAAVKVKDTIKNVDANGMITSTPDRNCLWQIQTPQVFCFDKIKAAYEKMIADEGRCNITDDAMVMENYGDLNVYVFEGDYTNIKVTTIDDLDAAENVLKKLQKS